jgi:pyrroloquinoline quinone biosynthesis protein D
MTGPTRLALDPAKPLAIAKHFRFQWEPAQNCHVLLYPEGMVKLPGSAGEIMQRVDGSRSLDTIVAELHAAFPDAPPDLRADVTDFLEVAHGNGWIRAL